MPEDPNINIQLRAQVDMPPLEPWEMALLDPESFVGTRAHVVMDAEGNVVGGTVTGRMRIAHPEPQVLPREPAILRERRERPPSSEPFEPDEIVRAHLFMSQPLVDFDNFGDAERVMLYRKYNDPGFVTTLEYWWYQYWATYVLNDLERREQLTEMHIALWDGTGHYWSGTFADQLEENFILSADEDAEGCLTQTWYGDCYAMEIWYLPESAPGPDDWRAHP